MDLASSTTSGASWWIEGFVSYAGEDLAERVGLVVEPYRESDPFPWWRGETTTWPETGEEQIYRAHHRSKACWGIRISEKKSCGIRPMGEEGWTRGELSRFTEQVLICRSDEVGSEQIDEQVSIWGWI